MLRDIYVDRMEVPAWSGPNPTRSDTVIIIMKCVRMPFFLSVMEEEVVILMN